MQLTAIRKFTGVIEVVTGLHIGAGDTEMHIGGTDNPVVKHPATQEPYIPGSSLKGKMRSLLEWKLGVVSATEGKPLGFSHLDKPAIRGVMREAKNLLSLFGGAPDSASADPSLLEEIGPTRLAFWDCPLDRSWVEEMNQKNLLLTETKMENMIDRIRGVAENPRNTERVPAGARFDFALTIRVHDHEDLLSWVFEGLKLLELTGLGGSGSRGYGKIRFPKLALDGEDVTSRLEQVRFTEAA
ncbi:MAG TPA: type III-A CRISPR-associated RAMP protein Csm3 [Candidatus Eisenbacteria bacterium]|nr:type III-A CRISPR-associated RAMP protein Csm3 [Candidatus Eisenbacteria bacterium]